ncbi:TetR/AcrR family transcriptional regulator [Rhodoligotrophos ferricapiens]|uniref:TetR/AcrR family transcriptional regulator n=1 Tax=Rhodoligotrophos ferricapiens TaxID=3069264 RepID=UPI00315CE0B7
MTRARILDAAAHMFRHKGYALTRLSDIAKRARTRTSSIYYYFESREAIVTEVLRIANEQTAQFVLDAVSALPPDAPVREKITAAMRGHFAIVLSGNQYTWAHMRIFDQIPPKLREHFLRVLDDYAEVWRNLLDEAKAAGEIRDDLDLSVVRLLMLGMMNWSIEWYKPSGRFTPDELASQAAILLFEGVGAKTTAKKRVKPQAKLPA